jgi:NAD dependent epimerase/dehydratase family enzyme
VNLVSPNPATSAQFTKALGRALRRPTVFPLPAFAVKTMFGEMGEAVLLDGQRVLPGRLLDAGFTFARPDLEPALRHALAG